MTIFGAIAALHGARANRARLDMWFDACVAAHLDEGVDLDAARRACARKMDEAQFPRDV